MKKLLHSVWAFVFCGVLLSCKSTLDKRIEQSLYFADYNRVALDSVLSHYERGSLKHKAACFLIANMPYYFSYSSPLIDSMRCLEKTFAARKYFINGSRLIIVRVRRYMIPIRFPLICSLKT